MAAATAPASLQLRLQRADLRVTPEDRRLEVVDHLRGAAGPGHRQQLELADLAQPRGPILVVPRRRLRPSTRRTADGRSRSSAAGDRRAGRSPRRVPARARCRPTERTARRRRCVAPTSRRRLSGAPPHKRASATSAAAASALPPPSPASTGIRLSIVHGRVAHVARAPERRPQTRRRLPDQILASSGMPGVRHFSVNGPGRSAQTSVSCSSMVWNTVRSSWYPSARTPSTRRSRLTFACARTVSGVVLLHA